jgi:hypothetical protein
MSLPQTQPATTPATCSIGGTRPNPKGRRAQAVDRQMTPKIDPTNASPPGDTPSARGCRCSIMVPATPDFRRWTERLADHVRLKRAVVIEHALIAFATANGFSEPAPRRGG